MVQPALWAVMVALAGLWEDFGVTPAAVAGHSQGEVAAACAAGILTVADGARVVVARSRVLGALAGTGAMASLPLAPEQARELLAGTGLTLAAVNGPRSVVVSGPPGAVRDLAARVDGARLVEVDYASHSPAVEAVRGELLAALEGITPAAGRVPFYSSVTGQRVAGESLDAAYWYRNLREPVAFGEVTRSLLADGHGLFVEASPHPVLTYPLEDTVASVGGPGAAVTGTLRRGDGGPARMLAALAAAWAHGAPVDWRPAYPGGHAVDLPTYAFQHTRYWLGARAGAGLEAAGLRVAGHPLLGAAVETAHGDGVLLTGALSVAAHPWLADHAIRGTVLVPGTALLEFAAQAGLRAGCERVEELVLHEPLALPPGRSVEVQVTAGAADESGARPVTVHSRAGGRGPWTRHAAGTLSPRSASPDLGLPGPDLTSPDQPDLSAWPPPGAEPADVNALYGQFAAAGYGYGPAFQALRGAWVRGEELYTEAVLPDGVEPGSFRLHPALLDALLHGLGLGLLDVGQGLLPFAWRGAWLGGTGVAAVRARIVRTAPGTVSVLVADDGGRPVGWVESLAVRPLPAGGLRGPEAGALFRVDWQPASVDGPPDGPDDPVGRWVLVGGAVRPSGLGWDCYPDLAALLAAVGDSGEVPAGVAVCCEPPPGAGAAGGARAVTHQALGVLQAWLAGEPGTSAVPAAETVPRPRRGRWRGCRWCW